MRFIGKKIIVSLLIASICIAGLPVSAAHMGYSAGAKFMELTDEFCVDEKNADAKGAGLTIQRGGQAVYNFYTGFHSESITFTFNQSGAKFTLIDVENERTYVIDTTEKVHTEKFHSTVYRGEHTFIIKADQGSAVSINSMQMDKMQIMVSNNTFQEVVMTPEETVLMSAIILHENASIIMVNNSRRYIDFENPTKTPLKVEGKVYLPVKALARALDCYYEDLRDKQYVLIRKLDKEFLFAPDICYKQQFGREREMIDSLVVYKDGEPYLPVREVAEYFGEKVGYKDGLIVLDDNKFTIEDILEDKTINSHVMSVLDEFMVYGAVNTGKTFYVAQTAENASDDNPGTLELPWKTLEKAGKSVSAGDTVIVKEGIYRETLTVKNSGTAFRPITFKAAEGERVVISAADEFTGKFVPYKDNILAAPVQWDLGYTKNQLFYNGESVPEGRHPNGPKLPVAEIGGLSDNWPVYGDIIVDTKKDTAAAYSETVLNQEEKDYWKGGTLIGLWDVGYSIGVADILGSEKGKLNITDVGKTMSGTSIVENPVTYDFAYGYIVGHINCLDAPGEWLIKGDTLFIIPPEGETAETLKVELKRRFSVIDIADNKYVNIEGFETIGGGAKMNNSEMCRISNCNMKNLTHLIAARNGWMSEGYFPDKDSSRPGAPERGESGIYVGGKDNVVSNNVLTDSALASIHTVGLYPYIENNYVDGAGYASTYCQGIMICRLGYEGMTMREPSQGAFVYQNTVRNTPRSGFYVKAAGAGTMLYGTVLPNYLGYNEFYGGMVSTLDVGIVYTGMCVHGFDRQPAQYHNNLVYNSYMTQPFSFGIYHDGGTQNVDTYENMIFTTSEDIEIGDYLHEAYAEAALANCDMWNNREEYVVEGGRDGLQPEDYPYHKPFDAGCTLFREPYTVNYDLRHTDLTQSLNKNDLRLDKDYLIPAEEAEMGDGASLNENGVIEFEDSGSWCVFRDVNFGEGMNTLELGYHADPYNLDGEDVEIRIDDPDSEIVYSFANTLIASSRQENIGQTKALSMAAYSGYHDVYIKAKNHHALKITGIRLYADRLEQGARMLNRVFGGTFDRDEYVQGDPNFTSVSKWMTIGNVYANATNCLWPGTVLAYKNVKITTEVDTVTFAGGSGSIYSGQDIQLRIGSRNAKPIAETFIDFNKGFDVLNEQSAKLNEPLPPGTYDFYLTFDHDPWYEKSGNLYWFDFHNSQEIPIIEGRTEPRKK